MTITPEECKFLIWLFREKAARHLAADEFPNCNAAINAVAWLFERQLNGDTLSEEESELANSVATTIFADVSNAALAAALAAHATSHIVENAAARKSIN